MVQCEHQNPKEANFCSTCGVSLRVEAELPIRSVPSLETPFGIIDQNLQTELELVDATEVIQIVRRPDETLFVDIGDTDPDTATALLAKGFVQFVINELLEFMPIEEDEDEEADDED